MSDAITELVQDMDWVSVQRKSDNQWMVLHPDKVEWVEDAKLASRQVADFKETLDILVKEFDLPLEVKDNPWPQKS